MKVLFLRYQDIYTTDLMQAFSMLGWEVKISIAQTAAALEQEIVTYEPNIIFTYGEPWYYRSHTDIVNYLGNRSKTCGYQLLYWEVDGMLSLEVFHLPAILAMKPDKVFTICKETYEVLQKANVNAGIMHYGMNPRMFFKASVNEQYKDMVSYVGNLYKELLGRNELFKVKSIEILVNGLVKNEVRIDVWGNPGMSQLYAINQKTAPLNFYHGTCAYHQLCFIYSNCYMNLATQNGPYHVSKRTYDILGSAGFALCSDSPGLREEFEVGKELVVVGSTEEALACIAYYKNHLDEYESIKQKGYQKVLQNYTYEQRIKKMLLESGWKV